VQKVDTALLWYNRKLASNTPVVMAAVVFNEDDMMGDGDSQLRLRLLLPNESTYAGAKATENTHPTGEEIVFHSKGISI
jgi:hypothetical protein